MLIVQNTGLYYLQNSKVDQGISANNVLSSIQASIKGSGGVASGYPVSSPTYTTSAQVLTLKLPALDTSGNFIPDTYDYALYYFDIDKLRYKVFPDSVSKRPAADQILAFNVNNVLFQYFDASGAEVPPTTAAKVKISITLKQKAGVPILQNIATTEAFLRND